MPTFPAPSPLSVAVDLPAGSTLHVVAGERDDVVVTVLPADPGKTGDMRAAAEVRVQHDHERVAITGQRAWKHYLPFAAGSVTISIELPAGSDLRGRAGALHTEGPLGAVEVVLAAGDARVDSAERLDLEVAAGSVVVRRATGTTSVRASSGSVRIGELAGDATIRCSSGTATIGSLTGSLDVSGAYGDLVVGSVRGALTAKASYGGVRVDRVDSGVLTLATSYGSVEVGVPEGTSAYLDVVSQHGTVRNQLHPGPGPVQDADTAEVHASTGYGDVIVRRP